MPAPHLPESDEANVHGLDQKGSLIWGHERDCDANRPKSTGLVELIKDAFTIRIQQWLGLVLFPYCRQLGTAFVQVPQ
jgi:hypothetical protein